MENKLSVGFARVNITPMRGIGIEGYFISRIMDGVLDDLHARCVSISKDGERVLLLAVDLCMIKTSICDRYRDAIAKATGLSRDAIIIHCQHTHTAPYVDPDRDNLYVGEYIGREKELILEYQDFVCYRLTDVALAAIENEKPAKMGHGIGYASNVAFIRRFRMKDGSVRTNPGVNNPDIVAPIGELDERVSVVRFDREGDTSVVLANYANHTDVVGGTKVSADWPGFVCSTVEQAIDNTSCIFFNGAQGDVNHVNVHPTKGYLNDLFMDFDDVARGYGHARHIGRVVAGAILSVYDKVEYVDTPAVKHLVRRIDVPSNMPKPEDMPEAKRINALSLAGRESELPYEGMMLTTVVAEAGRMVRLEHGPESFPITLSAVSLGEVALIGISGEPFNVIGREFKKTEGYGLIIPCCLSNGADGYFPAKDAYDEGGYEARSSNFAAGVAELLIDEGKKLLTELKNS